MKDEIFVPLPRSTEERTGSSPTEAVDQPDWLEEVVRRRGEIRALRAEFQARRDAGLRERHRIRLERAARHPPDG